MVFEVDNQWIGCMTNQMSTYPSMMPNIHVLVVDHESESLVNMVKLLELYHYKVTVVDLPFVTIQTMTTGNVKFDIIMANVNSPDLHGYKLVHHAVNMDIPVILMSSNDNTFMATKALESGAFLYVQKPATEELIRHLWQHVHSQRTRLMREREKLAAATRGIECGGPFHQNGGNLGNVGSNAMYMMRNKGKSKIREMKKHFSGNGNNYDIDNDMIKRKVCTEWTEELHAKFINAIEILGEGKCFPREILNLMNVPGLTRMQVSSHLQKCRNENWRTPEERKAMSHALGIGSSEMGGSHLRPRRFGSMPKIDNKVLHQRSQTRSETESGMPGNMENQPIMETNNVHHQVSVASQPVPSYIPSNDMNPSGSFFNIQGMDYLISDIFTPQGFATNTSSQTLGQYHYEAGMYPEKNNVVESMTTTTSPWSSEISNFASPDDSETRGRE